MTFSLVVDKRERDIIKLLKSEYTNDTPTNDSGTYKSTCRDGYGNVIMWQEEHLTVGDYIIFHNSRALVVIERKTWVDLAASIQDGRKENVHKLLNFRRNTNAKVAYLLEGTAFPAQSTKFARIPYGNLRAHLDHLIMRDNIIELRSATHHSTIERLFEFIRNISTLESRYTAGDETITLDSQNDTGIDILIKEPSTIPEETNHLDAAKIIHRVSDTFIFEKLWTCIPGISAKSAKLFRELRIADLIIGAISTKEIADLQYTNGRKIGTKKAKKIIQAVIAANNIHSYVPSIYAKLLAAIPGISRSTAQKILDNYPMTKLVAEWNDIAPALVNMSIGKVRLGKKKVGLIQKYLFGK
jgi:ERCC4-type nuclease